MYFGKVKPCPLNGNELLALFNTEYPINSQRGAKEGPKKTKGYQYSNQKVENRMVNNEKKDKKIKRQTSGYNKNVFIVHGCPTRTIIFHVQWTVKLGSKL